MKLIDEFRQFALKGNVVDLAVGVVIGAAFGRLVEGVVKGVIEPVVAVISGKGSMAAIMTGLTSLGSGVFNFLLLALVVFVVFVKPMNKLRTLMDKKAATSGPPETPVDTKLLTEIRDLLKNNRA
jgi:large conductance mechanosensitive channel